MASSFARLSWKYPRVDPTNRCSFYSSVFELGLLPAWRSSAGFKGDGNLEVMDEKERREKTNCSHYCTYKNQ